MMISIVPMSFLLSCSLFRSLEVMPFSPPRGIRGASGFHSAKPRADTIDEGLEVMFSHVVESREMCGASLPSYERAVFTLLSPFCFP